MQRKIQGSKIETKMIQRTTPDIMQDSLFFQIVESVNEKSAKKRCRFSEMKFDGQKETTTRIERSCAKIHHNGMTTLSKTNPSSLILRRFHSLQRINKFKTETHEVRRSVNSSSHKLRRFNSIKTIKNDKSTIRRNQTRKY